MGRGPWAGPVLAVACHFTNIENKYINFKLFNDSKKLSLKKRENCYDHLLELNKKKLVKILDNKLLKTIFSFYRIKRFNDV